MERPGSRQIAIPDGEMDDDLHLLVPVQHSASMALPKSGTAKAAAKERRKT